MRMNALIPLGIEYADPMRAIATGALARERVDANQTRNALAAAYAQHGAGAMQGDTNALAGIAQYDPAAAQTLYTGVQNNRRADANLDLTRQDTQSAIGARSAATRISQGHLDVAEQQAAANMAKASREAKMAAIATIGQFLPEFEAATTPEAWDRTAAAAGQDDLVGKFGERDMALAMGRGALRGASEETSTLSPGETLVGNRTGRVIANGGPKPVEPLSPEGKLASDVKAGLLDPSAAKPYDTKAEMDLRKEWTSLPQVKDFQMQTTAMGRIQTAAADPTAAGDLALIFSFMKILDPNSVVREQEFANAQNAAGVPDQIVNMYNRVLNGERLNPNQRQDFVGKAAALYRDAETQVGALRKQYEPIAAGLKLDASRALPNFGYTGELPPPGAAPPAQDGALTTKTGVPYRILD